MKKRNNAKAALTGLIIILAVMLSVMLVCTGCGKKSGSMAEEGTTQSLPTETIQTEQTTTVEQTETTQAEQIETTQAAKTAYKFRNYDLLKSHYKKHGKYMGFDSPEEYLAAANAVIANPEALTKTEKEDGDMVFYVEDTNEFVVLSTDGYIRTYFYPDSGKRYFDRQ